MVWFGRNLKVIQLYLPAVGGDSSHHPRSLQAPSNLTLGISRDEAAAASLGDFIGNQSIGWRH